MVNNFFFDLENAKSGERIVLDTFSKIASGYTFEDVSNERQYYHKGDIKATAANGATYFIEVKTDSRIADTKNVLCEEEVYYCDNDYFSKGNMYSDYQIYCVVSEKDKKIYVIDFKTLKENYKKGSYKVIPHYDQTTYCYLCNLSQIKSWGGLIAEVAY